MKFANLMLSALILMSLAACSDDPSDRDVRRALRKMTGNCKYFTITHVLKVNWAMPGTPDYQVDIQYSIQIAPLPDAKNVTAALTQPISALNARLASMGAERDKNFNANAAFLDRIALAQDAGDEPLAMSYEAQRSSFVIEKLEPSIKQAQALAAEKARVIKQGTSSLREAFLFHAIARHFCTRACAR